MPKDDGSTRWLVTITGSLFALITGVYMIGWHARGQTAYIEAVEVKTDTLRASYDGHVVKQIVETKEMKKTLSDLKENEAAQTIILGNMNKTLDSL